MEDLKLYNQQILRAKLPHKIQISGKIGSGKTYLARRLAETLMDEDKMMSPYQVFIESFADSLRSDVAGYFGIPFYRFTDPETKEQYRWMLLLWGNELCRRYDPDWWIKKFDRNSEHRYSSVENGNHYVICDDPRRINEYEYCRANGFATIRLTSNPFDTFQYLCRNGRSTKQAEELMQDPTECELDFLDIQQSDGVIRLKAYPGNSEKTFEDLVSYLAST